MSPRTTNKSIQQATNNEQQTVRSQLAQCGLFSHHPIAIDFQLSTNVHKEQPSPKQEFYNNKFRECR